MGYVSCYVSTILYYILSYIEFPLDINSPPLPCQTRALLRSRRSNTRPAVALTTLALLRPNNMLPVYIYGYLSWMVRGV